MESYRFREDDVLVSVRINLGGGRYFSAEKDIWEADRAYIGGLWGCLDMATTDVLTTSDDIEGTDDMPLYQTIRVGEEFRYRFDMDPGSYRVGILLAEIFWESRDAEAEDVYINGQKFIENYNIYDEAGHDVAVKKEFEVSSDDGVLEVRFVGKSIPMHSGARACGIEVVSLD